ncbi:S53 family peptidase [Sorangium sp. So ce385]|uniref:S53 family peptidase n=1 Tax=Sorangium sp. So ce385 TaxID=3133308 RepID=UPI003F5BACE4
MSEAASTVQVTLILRTREQLPSVDAVCRFPPSRAAHDDPDELPPPGHLSYDQLKAKYGADDDALHAVGRFVAQYKLRVVDGDSHIDDGGKLAGAAELKAEVTLEGPEVVFKDVESRVVGVLHVLRSTTAPRMSPRRVSLTSLLSSPRPGHDKEGGTSGDPASISARRVAEVYRYPPASKFIVEPRPCIGIVEMGGQLRSADVETYFKRYPPRPHIIESPATPPPHAPDFVFDVHVTMDAELAGTVCPGAQIVIYTQGSTSFTLQDLYRAISRAVFDTVNAPSVLSVIWCAPEDSGMTARDEAPFQELFVKAALLGITICVPSGDFGSMNPAPELRKGILLAGPYTSFPASSPLVLSCGGTRLVVERDGTSAETVWNQLGELWILKDDEGKEIYEGIGMASGGGVSRLNKLPFYQEGVDAPTATTMVTRDTVLQPLQQFAGRGVPDLAASADLCSGYDIYFDGKWGVGGATSAATPVLAGLFALLNQKLKRRVGFVNPRLYALQRSTGELFRRITRGSNGAYEAHSGVWNPCTGLGSPVGTAILEALKAYYGP